jgi:hypothetical protein
MLARLDNDPDLIAMSTDYAPTVADHYDSYSNEAMWLDERWHTWFCVYRGEALQCQVSHAYHEEVGRGPVRRTAWDTWGYFKRALKDDYGLDLAVRDPKYQPCFIHYGAFSKNRNINEWNVGLYRRLQILRRRGLFG